MCIKTEGCCTNVLNNSKNPHFIQNTLTSLISKPLCHQSTHSQISSSRPRVCANNTFSFNQAQVLAVGNVHTSNWMPQQCEMLMHIFECHLQYIAGMHTFLKVIRKYPATQASFLCLWPHGFNGSWGGKKG